MQAIKIKSIEKVENYNDLVYDISLKEDHKFFASCNLEKPPVLVHNCDFMVGGREKVREYLKSKYGEDSVFGVLTLGLYHAKSALQDASRGLGKDTSFESTLMSEISKLPDLETQTNLIDFFKDLETNPNSTVTILKWIRENQDVIYWGNKMLGMCKNVGTHAGGIVITPGPIYDYIPVTRASSEIVTAFREADGSGKDLSELGILKLDILGLKTLNVIRDCINDVKRDLNIDITNQVKYVNLKDKALYRKFNKGNNVGIFQMSGSTQDSLIKSIKPDCFDDIVAINAINRPGPLESFANVFGKWKRILTSGDKEEIEKIKTEAIPFDFMEESLKSTYYCLLYQEKIYLPQTGHFQTIEEVENKQSIISYCSNSHQYLEKPIKKTIHTGTKQVNKYILATGYEINCTPDHKILTVLGEMEIEKAFREQQPILLPKILPVAKQREENEVEEAKYRILGLLLGDGSVKKSNVYFTNTNEVLLKDFEELIEKVYPRCITRRKHKPQYSSATQIHVVKDPEKYKKEKQLNHIPNDLVVDLRKWGLRGTGSQTKFIPLEVFTASNKSKLSLLSGLWDSDGTLVNGNYPSYCTISQRLSEDIVLLCRQLGFLPRLSKTVQKNYSKTAYNVKMHVREYVLFENQVLSKHKKLTETNSPSYVMYNNTVSGTVLTYFISQISQQQNISFRQTCLKLGIDRNLTRKKTFSYDCVKGKVPSLDEVYKVHYAVEIKKSEDLGIHPVWDLNVGVNYPWFVAGNGGVLVHNCLLYQEQFMLMVRDAAGFNLGEADNFRRALGWTKEHPKYHTVEKYFLKLEEGMLNKGYSKDDVDRFLEYCKKFMGYSYNNCLTVNHKVQSKERGHIPLLEVKIGEEILCYDVKTKKNIFNKVKNKFEHGKKDVVKVELESGEIFECTLEHKFLTPKGMLPLKEIIKFNLKIKTK